MPSIEHSQLQDRFITWLTARATVRGVRAARELKLADGYVADIVGLFSLQNQELCNVCRHWELTRHCEFGLQVDHEKLGLNYFAIVAEVKVARADFLKTFTPNTGTHDNRHNPVADMHVIVTPRGLVRAEEAMLDIGFSQYGNSQRFVGIFAFTSRS